MSAIIFLFVLLPGSALASPASDPSAIAGGSPAGAWSISGHIDMVANWPTDIMIPVMLDEYTTDDHPKIVYWENSDEIKSIQAKLNGHEIDSGEDLKFSQLGSNIFAIIMELEDGRTSRYMQHFIVRRGDLSVSEEGTLKEYFSQFPVYFSMLMDIKPLSMVASIFDEVLPSLKAEAVKRWVWEE